MNRFLIVRFGSIGNTLVSIPAVRAIKKHYPDSFIAMIVSPGVNELISGLKWIDEQIVYDMNGVHKKLPDYLRFIYGLRKRHFDTAIMFKRFLRSELIGLLSGAKRRIGFETNKRSFLLTDRVKYIEGENIVELNMKLLTPLDIHDNNLSLEIELEDGDSTAQACASVIEELKSKGCGKYAVIHPGGRTLMGKGLIAEGYAEIITKLKERHQIPSAIVGDASEIRTIEKILNITRISSATAAVGLPIKEIARLIKYANIFIGNDSGPCHIADAVGTPGIIIYPPMNRLEEHIRKWKPAGNNYIVIPPPRLCDICSEYPCSDDKRSECMRGIDIELILKYTWQIINKEVQ